MAFLEVEDFSCVKEAQIELSSVVVLIGPQASGKSVLSKLSNFLAGLPSMAVTSCRTGKTYREFKGIIESRFKEQFPPATWHEKPFRVALVGEEIELSVSCGGRSLADNAKATFDSSDGFKALYTKTLRGFRKAAGSRDLEDVDEYIFRPTDSIRLFDRRARRLFSWALKDLYVQNQTFIPAGRAFFTNIGSILAAFDRGGFLDPISREFGTLYGYLRESAQRRIRFRDDERDERDRAMRKQLSKLFFGGELKFGKQDEYVEAQDGRKIPFSVLSSGQQELLPLWLSLEMYAEQTSLPRGASIGLSEIFIEEPEAHLFPSTQSILIEYLGSLTGGPRAQNRMFITTHSPYVLTKINNLMFAHTVASQLQSSARVEKIIPKESWLDPANVRAYALQDGLAKNILEDDLVNADYLDSVSGDLAREFDKLLGLMPNG